MMARLPSCRRSTRSSFDPERERAERHGLRRLAPQRPRTDAGCGRVRAKPRLPAFESRLLRRRADAHAARRHAAPELCKFRPDTSHLQSCSSASFVSDRSPAWSAQLTPEPRQHAVSQPRRARSRRVLVRARQSTCINGAELGACARNGHADCSLEQLRAATRRSWRATVAADVRRSTRRASAVSHGCAWPASRATRRRQSRVAAPPRAVRLEHRGLVVETRDARHDLVGASARQPREQLLRVCVRELGARTGHSPADLPGARQERIRRCGGRPARRLHAREPQTIEAHPRDGVRIDYQQRHLEPCGSKATPRRTRAATARLSRRLSVRLSRRPRKAWRMSSRNRSAIWCSRASRGISRPAEHREHLEKAVRPDPGRTRSSGHREFRRARASTSASSGQPFSPASRMRRPNGKSGPACRRSHIEHRARWPRWRPRAGTGWRSRRATGREIGVDREHAQQIEAPPRRWRAPPVAAHRRSRKLATRGSGPPV